MSTQHPLRWGPFPQHQVTSIFHERPYRRPVIYVPDVECPVKTECLGHQCSYAVEGRDCMGRILPEDVASEVKNAIGLSKERFSERPGPEIQI